MKADMLRYATFSRFDIVEAWYVWLCTHHIGIVPGSPEYPDGRDHPRWWCSYNRLSWIPNRLHFRPRYDLVYETLEENAKLIHDDLCRRLGTCGCLEEKSNGS